MIQRLVVAALLLLPAAGCASFAKGFGEGFVDGLAGHDHGGCTTTTTVVVQRR